MNMGRDEERGSDYEDDMDRERRERYGERGKDRDSDREEKSRRKRNETLKTLYQETIKWLR